RLRTDLALCHDGFTRARSDLVCRRFALAALRISRANRSPMRHLWRDALRDRLLSRESFQRMEMESADLHHAMRGVDLRRLCLRCCRHTRPTIAVNKLQRFREKVPSLRCGNRFARELGLSPLAAAG